MQLLSIGAFNKLPHYSVIGDPTNFYVWVNEDGGGDGSKWIKGNTAFTAYNKIKDANKTDAITMIKELYASNRKP